MNIFVCIRQVPDTTTRIKLCEDSNRIDETDIQWIISPHDELAIEEALQLRDRQPGSTVTVLSAGPERVTESLRMALAMGADSAVRLDLPGDADSAMNTQALAAAIGQLGAADVGKQGIRPPVWDRSSGYYYSIPILSSTLQKSSSENEIRISP